MAIKTADIRAWVQRYRVQSEGLGVAVLAAIVFLVLGTSLHRRIAPVRVEIARLSMSSAEISAFRTAFKPSSSGAELTAAILPESLSVSVPRETRFSLAESIAARAEQSGMADVRIRFASADSAAAPTGPAMLGTTVAVADYTIGVDGSGGFASVLSFVNHLPPSVALQRLSAERTKTGTSFHLILAVFEAAGPKQHG